MTTFELDIPAPYVTPFVEYLRGTGNQAIDGRALDLIAGQIEAQVQSAEPVDPAARVIDTEGDVWASHDGMWYSLTGQSSAWTWRDLTAFCGPLEVRP